MPPAEIFGCRGRIVNKHVETVCYGPSITYRVAGHGPGRRGFGQGARGRLCSMSLRGTRPEQRISARSLAAAL